LSNLDTKLQGLTVAPYLSPDYILEVNVKGQGHILVQLCGGEGTHVDAVRQIPSSSFRTVFLNVNYC